MMNMIWQFYWRTMTFQFDGSDMPQTLGGNILLAIPLMISSFFLDLYLGDVFSFTLKIILILIVFSFLHPIARMAALTAHTIVISLKFLLLLFGIIGAREVYSILFVFGEIIFFFLFFTTIAKNSSKS